MKVLALNSSLRRGGQSKTELLMTHLVKGMREAGAEVEVVNLRDEEINYCVGCYTCMTRSPGRCVLNDDMTNALFPQWLEADLVVYATPLFHHTVNAPMKTFIERTFPSVEPFLEQRNDGRWTHPARQELPKAVVLSVCGFPEASAFGALQHYVRFLFGQRLVAEIYRPGAEMMVQQKPILDDILDAATQAGRELVTSMEIAPQTLVRITQPLTENVQSFAQIANLMWKTCIAEGVTIRTFERRGQAPRPDSIESFARIMPMGFNPQAAGDAKAVMQFVFSGETEGACVFTIKDGTIETTLGRVENPDLTIKAPFELWMDVITGKADGGKLFMAGKYTAEGNVALLTKMDSWFSRDDQDEAGSPTVAQTQSKEKSEMDQDIVTCRALIMGMPTTFSATAAGDLVADIAFKVTGEEPGEYTLRIANGKCTAHEGAPASPALTIETPSEVWVAISRGELDGQQAFMAGKYKASGDFSLMLKMNSLFGTA